MGPNGAGKSTLLKMIAAGELKVPPRVDYLYVEQEVMADETPAVDAGERTRRNTHIHTYTLHIPCPNPVLILSWPYPTVILSCPDLT